jgi:hypothetical protein
MDPLDRDYYRARIAAEENAAEHASHPLGAFMVASDLGSDG